MAQPLEALVEEANRIDNEWRTADRWQGVRRGHAGNDVVKLRGSLEIEPVLARRGAERLWSRLVTEPYLVAAPARSPSEAVAAAMAHRHAAVLEPEGRRGDGIELTEKVVQHVRAVRDALRRADRDEWLDGRASRNWLLPIVARVPDVTGALESYELVHALLEAGAGAIVFGARTPTSADHASVLRAARLAADVLDVPAVLVGATEARFELNEAIERALAIAPYVDVVWLESDRTDLEEARLFARAVHSLFPQKPLAYDCRAAIQARGPDEAAAIRDFQWELGRLGFRLQLVEPTQPPIDAGAGGEASANLLGATHADGGGPLLPSARAAPQPGARYMERILTLASRDGAASAS